MSAVKQFVMGYLPDDWSIAQQEGLAAKMGVFAIGTVFGILGVSILSCCSAAFYFNSSVRRMINKLKNKVVWNMFIKMFQGGYLSYLSAPLLAIAAFDYSTFDGFNYWILDWLAITVTLSLAAAQYQYVMSHDSPYLSKMKHRYGATHTALDIQRKGALK